MNLSGGQGVRSVFASVVALAVTLTLAAPAFAATQTMNVETSSGAWSFAGNWNNGSGPAPSNGDDVILAQGGAANTIYDLDPSVQLQSITLQNRATDPWTLFTLSGSLYRLKSGGSLTDSNSTTGPDRIGGIAVNGPTSITLVAGAIGLQLNGGISGTGPVTYTNSSGNDQLAVNAATSYTGGTTIANGPGLVLFKVNGAVPTTSALTVNGLAHFAQDSTIGSLAGSVASSVFIDSPHILTVGGDNSNTTFAGLLASSGGANAGLSKAGTGTFTISGNGSYQGPTTVNAGTLLLNGDLGSPVTVNSGGTFGGIGRTQYSSPPRQPVTVHSGGTIAPGSGGAGQIKTGSLTLDSGSNLAEEFGAGVDQVQVDGDVSLGGANLNLSVLGNPGLVTGFIIANLGSNPVSGTFAGLPDGAIFSAGGRNFQISYFDGDGNDVSLTTLPPNPTAAIATPPDGASYAQGQVVNTSFTCTEGTGGPGIDTCLDQSGNPSGSPLDTSTPGTHTLTVTATSLDDLTGTASADYTVTPASTTTTTTTTTPTPPPAGEDPRCARLRAKLKRQKKVLARATTERKRAFIQHNIGQTKTRLRVFNCAA